MRQRKVFALYLGSLFAYLDPDNAAMHLQIGQANAGAAAMAAAVVEPDNRLMRRIEKANDIPETGVDDFRRTVAANIAHIGVEVTWPAGYENDPVLVAHGERIDWTCIPELKKAIESYCATYPETEDLH